MSDDESYYSVNCKSDVELGNVYIPRTYNDKPVTEVNGFYNRPALESVYIPDCVTKIAGHSFGVCENLTKVRLPNGVVEYGDNVFSGSRNITPHAVDELGNEYLGPESNPYYFLYKGDKDITEFTVPSNVKEICNNAFLYGDLTTLTIPSNVYRINDGAFSFNYDLASVTLASYGVDIIGMQAFACCVNLQTITIHRTTSIHVNAFTRCYGLETINVDAANENYSSIDGVLYNKDQTELVIIPEGTDEEIHLPNTVTTIGNYAASLNYQNTDIHTPTIYIPTSVTRIKSFAFHNSHAHLVYAGNQSQWESITKDDNWDYQFQGELPFNS